MATLTLPGLTDVHVHTRDPGAPHKEDWDSVTRAALAGGFSRVLAMPNTTPPVVDRAGVRAALDAARARARCDYGQFGGATANNANEIRDLEGDLVGLKMVLDQTFGPLLLGDMDAWIPHLERWPAHRPLAVHAEGRTLAAAVLLAELVGRPVHLCHVSRREEVVLIRRAKERGLPVTCEATPHHLLLCRDDASRLGPGRSRVCPALATAGDRDALWEHLEVIDCFATDHAPHTAVEKDAPDAPPGFPGLEAALPLLLWEVDRGRLTLDDVVRRLDENPRRIFGLPEQEGTRVEVEEIAPYRLDPAAMQSRAGWSPYAGREVRHRVTRVVLRGRTAFDGAEVLAPPGSGRRVP